MGGYHQGMLHSLGSGLSRATMPGWGQCGVEGWLVATRVVTGNASCEGGASGLRRGLGQVPGALPWGLEGLVAGGGRLQLLGRGWAT